MNLAAQIDDHRHLFRDELDFNPTQRTPPVAFTYDSAQRALVPDDRPLVIKPFTADALEVPDSATQSTQVGMPMSSRMLRYLSGPAADTPWAFALKRLRAHCRRSHPHHRGSDVPYWRGSLCWQLVFLVIVGKPKGNGPATVAEAARILRYDAPEPVLRYALTYIEESIDAERAKAERRAMEDAGIQTRCRCGHGWPRHDNPGMGFACIERDGCTRYEAEVQDATVHHVSSAEHVAECPNPECRRRRAA